MEAKNFIYDRNGKRVRVTIPEKVELPDEFNPVLAFQGMSTSLISNFANGTYDVQFYLRRELASRGYDINGRFIGFRAAAKEHKV